MSAADILDVLLPDATRADRDRARRLATALRLLLHAGRGERADDVECSVDAARRELAARARRARVAALEALLHHHLTAHAGAGAFQLFGEAAIERDAAWRTVLEEGEGAPALPAPGEPALAVAARLLDALARFDDDGRATAVWSARMRSAADGPVEGERAFRALVSVAGPFALRRAAVAGVAACLLERGRVGEARAWLLGHEDLAAADPEIAWHLAWCELCTGDEAAARAVVRGLSSYRGVLPRPLAALRRAHEAWLPLLPGREPGPVGPVRAFRPGRPPGRGDVGAHLLAVFALGPANEVVPLHLDVAPALRDRAGAWARGRDGAASDPAAPEHELVAGACALVRHRGRAVLNGALDPLARAQALVPVLFTHGSFEGDVAGWVALELAHHLAPAEERLAWLADAWRGPVLEAAWQARGRAAEAVPAACARAEAAVDRDDPRARAARAFVETLGMKTAQRRWWFFDLARDGRRLVAWGGAALGDDAPGARGEDEGAHGAGARALARAQATGAAIHFDVPDRRLSLHPAAASGVVLPVRGTRGSVALFAVESERRGDFPPAARERLAVAAASFHDAWVAARFSAWHRERYDDEVQVSVLLSEPAALDEVLAAGRAQMPAAVVGPPGAGKHVIARWLHLEGAGCDAVAREFDLASEGAAARRGGGAATWIVSGLGAADPAAQRELLTHVGQDGPRLIALLPRSPLGGEAEAEAGDPPQRLLPELARRLCRLVLRVRPLCERRRAIPALVDVLVRRVAAEEGLAAPSLADEAVALLWRQPWPRNVRELEAVVARLVLTHPGEALDARAVAAVAARVGPRLVKRLPSRHPRREDLLAALWTTRCASGRPNKTRAALYLGWDPDTLVARLKEARIDASEAVRDVSGPL